MLNRNHVRYGFDGNYSRGSGNTSPPSTPLNHFNQRTETKPAGQASVNPPRTETMVKVATVMTVNTSLPQTENKVKPDQNSRLPCEMSQFEAGRTRKPGALSIGHSAHSREEITESPSVKRFVANFEKKDSWSVHEEKTPVPRTKVNELKESLLRRSQENLSEIDSDHSTTPSRSTENLTKWSVAPSREEVVALQEVKSDEDDYLEPVPRKPSLPTTNGATKYPEEVTETEAGNKSSSPVGAPEGGHVRQKSLEEIEYDQHAKLVASHLKDKDKELSEVILPPPEHKTTTDFMSGIFDTNVDYNRRPSLLSKNNVNGESERRDSLEQRRDSTSSANSPNWSPLSHLQTRSRTDGSPVDHITSEIGGHIGSTTLERQKEELVGRLQKKLEILQQEKDSLREEMKDNDKLGREVRAVVEEKCPNKPELDKFKLYVDELDKVMYLLLKLSGRLARAENALRSLPKDCSEKERAALTSRRDELCVKHEDAKQLKEGIDRRSQQVATYLVKYLTEEEFADYEHFIKMKSKLTMDHQEIDDKIKLGEEQLQALRKSIGAR